MCLRADKNTLGRFWKGTQSRAHHTGAWWLSAPSRPPPTANPTSTPPWGEGCSRAPSTKTCPNSPRFAQNLLSTQSEGAKYGSHQFAALNPPALPAPRTSALPRCAAVHPSASPLKGLRLSSLFF